MILGIGFCAVFFIKEQLLRMEKDKQDVSLKEELMDAN